MELLLSILLFLVGLTAIIKGADWLTDGAAAVAQHLGVPTIVVGLTIVAVGSSMPEFVVSVMSAFKGSADMAVGNIVGSNIFNILGILGITALVAPISVQRANVRNDVPFMLLSSIVALIVAYDGVVERNEGMLMLCLFLIFVSYTLSIGATEEEKSVEPSSQQPMGMGPAVLRVVVGLALLLLGGNWLVDGGAGTARLLGMSESLVALTIVSIGTSAPELAASVMAARKGDHGMALGNVVGSVVFNVFYVLGTASVVLPLQITGLTVVDLGTLLVAPALLWIVCRFGQRDRYEISRMEGALLVCLAVAYYGWLIVQQIL